MKKIVHENRGSSIISVMVSFMILMLGILMVSTSVTAALKVSEQAIENRTVTESALEAYYSNPADGSKPIMQHFTLVPQKSVDQDGDIVSGIDGKQFEIKGPVGYQFDFTYSKLRENKYSFYYFAEYKP